MQLSNESCGDENYTDAEEVSNRTFEDAKIKVMAKLAAGDEDLRAIAIDHLIASNSFWDSVARLGVVGDIPTMNVLKVKNEGIGISCEVFNSMASEILREANR